jgi:hypothetical protein
VETLLYISNSLIVPGDAEREVHRIVDTAVAYNPTVGLTGALLFTGVNFAQVLEGDSAALDQLIGKIIDDPRHEKLTIVTRSTLDKRRFPDWSMAYFGPSQFVSRHVTRLLNDPSPSEYRRGADWLNDLLKEFSADPRAVT